MRRILWLAAIALSASSVRPADACSYAFPDGWRPGYDTPTVDDTPPAPPTVVSYRINRNPLGPGERAGGGDCAGNGTIYVEIAPGADDQTPAARMGFRLEDADGNPIGNPFQLAGNEAFIIFSDRGGDVALTYTIVQIDLGNNESTPVTFEVIDEEGGCAAGGSATSWWLIAGAALLARRRRRRRATT